MYPGANCADPRVKKSFGSVRQGVDESVWVEYRHPRCQLETKRENFPEDKDFEA